MNDLRQIAPFYCGTKLNFSGAILLAQQALDECGFAGSIISQQRDPLPCLHIQINIRKEDLVSECLGDIFHFEHHIAGKLLLAEGSPHGLFRLWLFGLLDALHTVLDGHGPAVKGAVIDAPALHAFHGKSKLLQLRLLLLILLHLQVKPCLLFVHIERVVAGVKFRMSVHDLNDPVGYLVDEVTVMGDGEHCPLESLDILLQPFHAVQIQVVGRLIQQENIRLFQQKPGKVYPGLFTAGQAGKLLTALLLRDAQTVADLIHLYIHLVAAAGLKLIAQGVVFPQLRLRCAGLHYVLQTAHPLLDAMQIGVGGTQHVLHVVALRENGNLRN